MCLSEKQVSFASVDGLVLRGTLVVPGEVVGAVVLVHGGGVTREEGGFFTRLARGLAEAGLMSLRFDLRAHGESEGRMEELTLSGAANDVRAASQFVLGEAGEAGGERVGLIAASFGGGLAVLHAARYPGMVERLALINPLLHYERRFVDQKPERWQGGSLSPQAAVELARDGFLPHSAAVRHGRAMLNEVFHVRPDRLLGEVRAPTLIVHGTADTFIPLQWSQEAAPQFGRSGAELVVVEGMQHGVAMPDDPRYLHPQTRAWQAETIARFAAFFGGRADR
ncbi:alpha/beta hydrolase [Actinomadura violacea]|uniref:Alpha/beta fold hydrolase n=1 Tax=Actinomadura violacea TaxID=2819934 RepID=A0ABS3RYP1_9ACTN|nr:alpha/beta fold hydrolase [Actinomadura violacea]MBO2461766.1 alpha/beta fold hydrolase [Actinomadura violacea]